MTAVATTRGRRSRFKDTVAIGQVFIDPATGVAVRVRQQHRKDGLVELEPVRRRWTVTYADLQRHYRRSTS